MQQWFRGFLVSTIVVLLTACGGGGEKTTVDTTPPVITLNGEASITLNVGDAYTEAGATATDVIDGAVTVTTSGSVDVNTVGSYTITYKAVDSAGNEATVTRTVNVIAQTYTLEDGNHALMGPLSGATVKVYKLSDLENSIEENQTSNLGAFSVSLNGIDDNELLLVSVSGGVDIDANDDGVIDDTPITNNGKIRGWAKASELRNGNVNITLLSEIVYQYSKHLIGEVHQDDLEQAMNTVSAKLLKENININNFLPMDNESKNKLDFDYSALIGDDSLASAIYSDSNSSVLESKLNVLLSTKLSLGDISLVQEKNYFKISLVEPIKSTITSDDSNIFINTENNTSKLIDFISKDSNVSFTVTPSDDVKINRWDGCDQVSNDLSTCYLYSIQEDKLIIPTVTYTETIYADNVKDLTGFYTTVADDNVTYTISLDLNDSSEKRALIESIIADDIIINTSDSQKYFRKVISVTKVDEYNYNMVTSDVSFLELYKQGSATLNRELTHEDLAESTRTINRSLRNQYGNIRLLPPTKPNDNVFVLEFGKSITNNESLNRAIESEESEAFQLTEGVKLEGKLSFKLDADFNFNTSWSYLVPTLDSMRFAIKSDIKSELKIIGTVEFANFNGEKQIGQTLRFRIPVPSSPIWVDATLTFYIGGTGKLEGIVTVGGEAGVNTKIGFNYVNGHIRPIGDFTPNGKLLATGEVKFSTGAYLKSLPSLTVLSIAGMGIDNRLGIYAESSIVNGYSTSGSECDMWKGKAYAKFSTGPVFTWDPWLREFDWAEKIEKDVNAEYSRSSSLSWVLKEWSNPCTENPSYLDVTGEDIEESIIASEGIDKSYAYTVKNTGEAALNWKIEKTGSLSDIITISPTSGTLSKDESVEILVVISNNDMSEYTGSTQSSYLKFINNAEDNRSILEKGGKTFTISVNTEAGLIAPMLNYASLTGDSIKKVDFGWDYEGTDIDGFKMYKSNCTDDYETFKVMQEPSKRNLSLNYENIASSLVAGESYCFKISSYKNGIESDLSNSVTLDIPEYATLVSNIKDIDNNPLPSATVRLTVLSNSQEVTGTGDYTFEDLMPGRYLITAEAEGYIATTTVVELTSGQTLIYEAQLMLDEDLEDIVGTVGGKVRDATNNETGIAGVLIQIREGGGNTFGEVVKTLTSDSSGDYIIEDLVSGTYTFTWSKDGYITDSTNVVVVGNQSRTYDLSMSEVLTIGTLRATLRWGANPRDLDSHLVKSTDASQDYHIYYSHLSDSGDSLDTDDTTSYGPETVTINSVSAASSYTYYVYHYAGSGSIATSGATVTVQTSNGSNTYYAPNSSGTYWRVFDIVNGVVEPCTEGCMGSSAPSTRSLHSVSDDAYLFENLPPKE